MYWNKTILNHVPGTTCHELVNSVLPDSKIGQAQKQFIINIEMVHTGGNLSRSKSQKETELMNSMSSTIPVLIFLLQFTPVA